MKKLFIIVLMISTLEPAALRQSVARHGRQASSLMTKHDIKNKVAQIGNLAHNRNIAYGGKYLRQYLGPYRKAKESVARQYWNQLWHEVRFLPQGKPYQMLPKQWLEDKPLARLYLSLTIFYNHLSFGIGRLEKDPSSSFAQLYWEFKLAALEELGAGELLGLNLKKKNELLSELLESYLEAYTKNVPNSVTNELLLRDLRSASVTQKIINMLQKLEKPEKTQDPVKLQRLYNDIKEQLFDIINSVKLGQLPYDVGVQALNMVSQISLEQLEKTLIIKPPYSKKGLSGLAEGFPEGIRMSTAPKEKKGLALIGDEPQPKAGVYLASIVGAKV